MPAYPHPPQPQTPPRGKSRVRAAFLRGLAGVMRGAGGEAPPPERLAAARILIIRPDHLGDLLFLGPALRWLRARLPAARITLAMGPWGKPALPGLTGAYDEIIELPFPAFERGPRAGAVARWRLLYTASRSLRGKGFDVALISRPDHWWGAMLARLAGIPFRLGFATPETTPWLSRALPLPHEHAAASNLHLAAALTHDAIHPDPRVHPLRFTLTDDALDQADAILARGFGKAPAGPLVVIHPGSGAAVKLWETEKWQEIARRLVARDARVLVSGGPGEESLTQAVAAADARILDLGGRTSFALLAALLARADLVLGPDSGPLHLAVAVGTPSIHLYGPADPVIYGPWGDPDRHRVITSTWDCAPCGRFDWPDLAAHACVRDISVEKVWAAIADRLFDD